MPGTTIPVIAKLVSESLLSLYPVFVKKIGLEIPVQLWTRLIAYIAIAALFVNWSFIRSAITSPNGLLLGLVTLIHIYVSYEGFKYLDSGVSFSLFNLYPFMILLLSRAPFHPAYLIALLGFGVFVYDNYLVSHQLIQDDFSDQSAQSAKIESMENPSNESSEKKREDKEIVHSSKTRIFQYGLVMILLSAFTEALIYFIIRRVKTTNHWDHLFISYFPGAIVMSLYMIFLWIKSRRETFEGSSNLSKDSPDSSKAGFNQRILIALLLNGVIGSVGYVSRFFAAYRLEAKIYAILSYFGIVMAYIYGIGFNKEKLTDLKVIGTILIILANYLVLRKS